MIHKPGKLPAKHFQPHSLINKLLNHHHHQPIGGAMLGTGLLLKSELSVTMSGLVWISNSTYNIESLHIINLFNTEIADESKTL